MQRLKGKKLVSVLFFILIVFLIVKRDGIDGTLSELFGRENGQTYSNVASEMDAVGELLSGDIICQRLYLERGALEVGVRVGTYARTNNAEYMFTVYDGDGNVLGRNEASASGMRDNQMHYVSVYARTRPDQAYYITVKSLDAEQGNGIACYGTAVADGHEAAVWNGSSLGLELVTEVVYQKVFPVAEYTTIAFAVLFFLYLFYGEIERIANMLGVKIWKAMKKNCRRLLLSCMFIGVAGVLLLLLFPVRGWNIVRENVPDEEHETAKFYEEKWTQTFTAARTFEAIEVKLGTYMTSYEGGWLVLALYNEKTGELLAEKRVSAKRIEDNQFLHIETGEMEKGMAYRMELWLEDFAEQPLALYCTEDGDSLIFHLLQSRRAYTVLGIFASALLAVVSGTWYFCLSCRLKKKKGIASCHAAEYCLRRAAGHLWELSGGLPCCGSKESGSAWEWRNRGGSQGGYYEIYGTWHTL